MSIYELSNYTISSIHELNGLSSFKGDDKFLVSKYDSISENDKSMYVDYKFLSSEITKSCVKSVIGSDSITVKPTGKPGEVMVCGNSSGVKFSGEQKTGNIIGYLNIGGVNQVLKTGNPNVQVHTEFEKSSDTYKIAQIDVNGVEKEIYIPKDHEKTTVEVVADYSKGQDTTRIATIIVDGKENELYIPNSEIQGLQEIFNLMYPIGSVYTTLRDTTYCPLQEIAIQHGFGIGRWIEIGQGRCLFGYDGKYQVGQEIEAGLPELPKLKTGTLDFLGGSVTRVSGGALSASNPIYNCVTSATKETKGFAKIKFDPNPDPSLMPSIFGSSDTVQPPALVVRFWQRLSLE